MQPANPTATLARGPETLRAQHCSPWVPSSCCPCWDVKGISHTCSHTAAKVPDLPSQDHMAEQPGCGSTDPGQKRPLIRAVILKALPTCWLGVSSPG